MNLNNGPYAIVAFFALFHVLSLPVSAAQTSDDIYISDNELQRVSVKWIEPKSFTDVKERNFSNAKYRKHVFSQLEKHLDKLAKDLPQGQFLSVTVTDVDLAGSFVPASFIGLSTSMDNVRIMRNVDIPRLEFTYQLIDASGKILGSEEVNLKNMNYLHGVGISGRNQPFAYEKEMLSKWFTKSIIDDNA